MSALKNSLTPEVARYDSSIPASRTSGASESTSDDALADALARILTGRTLAEHLWFEPPAMRPATAEQGIAWILAGAGAGLVH